MTRTSEWRLLLSHRTARDIDALAPGARERVLAAISRLPDNPDLGRIVALKDREDTYVLRVDKNRVVFLLLPETKEILVAAVFRH